MSVEIEPFELSFQRPFTKEVSETLTIRNPNATAVAFKVKTTAPKQYCVRPNSGRIEPGGEEKVHVLLQAMKQEPAPDAKCKDKFLVQSAIVPEGNFPTVPAVFDAVERSAIQEKKIRVAWLAPVSDATQVPTAVTPIKPHLINGQESTPDVSRAYDSPAETDAASTAPPAYDSEVKDESPPPRDTPSAPPAAPPAVTNVTKAVQLTYEELKAKLEAAEAQLAALKDNSGLRQRAVKATDTTKEATQQLATAVRQNVEGVPVQIVAALCFLSFLLAYIFF